MRAMLKRLHDVRSNLNVGGESEYAYALYLSHTALVRTEELAEYDANGDHALNALKQLNETWTAQIIEPIFRELMFVGYS